jgi:hypothetical protein
VLESAGQLTGGQRKDAGFRKVVVGELRHPLPQGAILLIAVTKRSEPEPGDLHPEVAECRIVGCRCVVSEEASDCSFRIKRKTRRDRLRLVTFEWSKKTMAWRFCAHRDESGSAASGVANYNQKFKTPAEGRAGILARDLAGPSHPDFAAAQGGRSY